MDGGAKQHLRKSVNDLHVNGQKQLWATKSSTLLTLRELQRGVENLSKWKVCFTILRQEEFWTPPSMVRLPLPPFSNAPLTSPGITMVPKRITQTFFGNSWEFDDQLREALFGPTSEKRGVPSRTERERERVLEMLALEASNALKNKVWGSQPYSRGEFQQKL